MSKRFSSQEKVRRRKFKNRMSTEATLKNSRMNLLKALSLERNIKTDFLRVAVVLKSRKKKKLTLSRLLLISSKVRLAPYINHRCKISWRLCLLNQKTPCESHSQPELRKLSIPKNSFRKLKMNLKKCRIMSWDKRSNTCIRKSKSTQYQHPKNHLALNLLMKKPQKSIIYQLIFEKDNKKFWNFNRKSNRSKKIYTWLSICIIFKTLKIPYMKN